MLRYKSLGPFYRLLNWIIKKSPLPPWVTVRTKYGKLIVPKDFRVLTYMLDLIEPEVKSIFESKVKKANYFIDIGAGCDGWYTIKALRLNPKIKAIAFEPDLAAYHVLRANLAKNNLEAIALNIALSDENLGSKCRRLDDVLTELGVKLSSNDVIKIDVEGSALKVLAGASKSLEKAPCIIVELHPGEEELTSYLKRYPLEVSQVSKYFVVACRRE